ncbi:MAG TPA: oligosaccharide flippase family protein [Vicinamibacterales bacterium]|nr:oligosaccharide flippase family protein [Vicinamibacterales bacterium]
MTPTAPPVARSARTGFLHNVAWGWAGVAVNVVIGFLLSPILIRKLGLEHFGIWVLLFSLVDYFRMLDFGFRAAAVNACARARVREDWGAVNRTAATAILYFLASGVACAGLVILFRDPLIGALNVSPALRPEARVVLVVIACAVALRLVLSPLTAVLEAFQRFDLVNRAYIASLVLRSTASLTVLLLGFGLLEMAYVVLTAQVIENVWSFICVRQVLPVFRMSPMLVERQTFAALFRFGRYSAVMAAANLISIQAPATILGLLRGPTEVGFFSLPFRLLMYSAEGLSKVSDVTSSVTAGLDETRSTAQVWSLAILTNRHCLALFMPLAIFLAIWGTPLLRVWVSPEVGAESGRLIPILLIMFLFGVAGQYNAGAILIGQGKHAAYSYAVVLEVIASVICLFLFVPRYGVVAAAWIVSLTFVTSRGLVLAILICRQNGFPFRSYVTGIYGRPLLAAVPVLGLALWLRTWVWEGSNWPELIAAGGVVSAAYFALAVWLVLETRHRDALLRRGSQAAGLTTR